jgi:hypothetical protein
VVCRGQRYKGGKYIKTREHMHANKGNRDSTSNNRNQQQKIEKGVYNGGRLFIGIDLVAAPGAIVLVPLLFAHANFSVPLVSSLVHPFCSLWRELLLS